VSRLAGRCALAELVPADFGMLVRRAFTEFERQQRIFDLPERKFHRPRAGIDCSVRFHGQPASNPLGPAAGPQSQMIQNIVLAWLAGSRIFELKTVQINDTLQIPRPCIDATNVGYNVEWSQELRLEQSLQEYVAAAMLIEMLRASGVLDGAYGDDGFAHSESIFDLSVGYDLKGIRNPRVVDFMRGCMDAGPSIEALRGEIPDRFRAFRNLEFRRDLVHSATLSTFPRLPGRRDRRHRRFPAARDEPARHDQAQPDAARRRALRGPVARRPRLRGHSGGPRALRA
jgi:putative selenate reductase